MFANLLTAELNSQNSIQSFGRTSHIPIGRTHAFICRVPTYIRATTVVLSYKSSRCVRECIECISRLISFSDSVDCRCFAHNVKLDSIFNIAALACRFPTLPGCVPSQKSLSQWATKLPWSCAGISDRLVALFRCTRQKTRRYTYSTTS